MNYSSDFDTIFSFLYKTVTADMENLETDADIEETWEEDDETVYLVLVNDHPYEDPYDYEEDPYDYEDDPEDEEDPENEEYSEESDWSACAYLSIKVNESGEITEIEPSVRVYGDEGLGDSDPEDVWNIDDYKAAEAFLALITKVDAPNGE